MSAAGTQIAGAVLLSLGVFSRPTALAMSATMITAVVFHLLNTGPEAFPLGIPKAHSYNFELAAMYVFVLGYFSVAGAGKYSVDEQILGGELNFYSGLLDKAFGGEEEDYDMRQAIRRCVVVFLCVVSCVWSRRAIHILMAGIDACRRRSFLENETSERALR